MVVKKKIRIDLQSAGVPPIVHVMQNDEGVREVEVSLYNGGVEFVPENAIVTLAYKKPDGTSGWYDKLQDETPAISVDGNKVTATLAQQITSVAGNVFATIRIEDGLKRVSTFPFIVSVTADPANGSVKSENYYNVTNWDDVNSSFDDVYEKLDELEEQSGGKNCVLYTEQTLAPAQQAQARENIGAASAKDVEYLKTYVTPKMFGAKCDRVADDTQAFLAACATGKPVFAENCNIKNCEVENAIIHMKDCIVSAVQVKNCVISGTCQSGESTSAILAGDNTVIENCTIINPGIRDSITVCSGAAIYINGTSVTVSNCVIDAYYSSIHIGADNARILNCKFLDCPSMKQTPTIGMGFGCIKTGRATPVTEEEPFAPRNLLIEGCEFGDFTNHAISFWSGAYTATVKNCMFDSKRYEDGSPVTYIQIKSYNYERSDGLGYCTYHDYAENINFQNCVFRNNNSIACAKITEDLETNPDIGTTSISFDGCAFYSSQMYFDGAEMLRISNCILEVAAGNCVSLSNTANGDADRYHTLIFENNKVKGNAIHSTGHYNLFLYNNLIDAPYAGVICNSSPTTNLIPVRVVSKNNRIFTTLATAYGYIGMVGVFLSSDDQFYAKTFVQPGNNATVSIKNVMCEMNASRPIDCNSYTVNGDISYIHKNGIHIAQMINGDNATITFTEYKIPDLV